jgi:LuxR family maltose regulon positive regulatory protein
LHLAEWHRIHAHALDLLGSREAAERELASSLETGDHLSLVQPLIDERHILGSLLPAAARRVGLDLPGLEALEDAPVPRPVYIEPLTDREQVVLGYMATHLSYPEIAAELYVSNNTVKSHCKSIFRKLAVSRRADAVTRARAYGLIND